MARTERAFPASPRSHHRPCPICAGDNPKPLFRNTMAPLDGRDMSYDVARCGQCGFHYASDLPAPATYAGYYRDLSKYDQPGGGTIAAPLRERSQQALALCRAQLPGDARIVDIGCGAGALLHAFREAGYTQLHGIDPAPDGARTLLGDGYAEHILAGHLRDADRLPLAEADLVCLTGIAEHLPELRADIAWLCGKLGRHSRILIEVPSAEHFPSGEGPFEPFGEFSLEHLQYFDRNALAQLMADNGFRPQAQTVPELPGGGFGSLFGLFARGERPLASLATDASTRHRMDAYLAASEHNMQCAIDGIAAHGGHFVIYGAGSHTARLLPRLGDAGLAGRIVGLVDNNRNLHGKTLGEHLIEPSSALAEHPEYAGTTVLVSSFAAQEAIAASLPPESPVLLLYAKR